VKIKFEDLQSLGKDFDISDKRIVYTDTNGIRMCMKIYKEGPGIPFVYFGEDEIEEYECYLECEIQKDKTWKEKYYCNIHRVWFRSCEEPELCPAGEAYFEGYEECRKGN
jgi:hypothetical protein